MKLYEPKTVEVGWFVDESLGSFVFPNPSTLFSQRKKALSNRAVQACPAVNELERDLFVIKSPFDIRLRCKKVGDLYELHIVQQGTRIDDDLIPRFVFLMKRDLWRSPDRPVLQIKIPYFFLADEPCYMTQSAPHMSRSILTWPGLLISGRFPIDVWPRVLNWAFEWHDLKKDLVLRRNDDLCYFYFETTALRTKVDLFELEYTRELQEYRRGISGVPKYMSNTFSLFETAMSRRPKTLLRRKVSV